MTDFALPNFTTDLTGQVALVTGTTSGLGSDLPKCWRPAAPVSPSLVDGKIACVNSLTRLTHKVARPFLCAWT